MVERVLGHPIDASLRGEHIRAWVATEPKEDDVDFKTVGYHKSKPTWQTDLATDVCALANGAGGVLVCGVTESKGRATGVEPYDFNEGEVNRLVGALSNCCEPRVPAVGIVPVPDDETSLAFGLILVPPSDLARTP